MALGLSFSPTAQNDRQSQQGGPSQTPIQDAIKVLSLRIPSFVGAGRGIAPDALLQSPGSAGLPGVGGGMPGGVPGGLEELLRRLFGQGGMPPTGMPSGMPPMGPAPTPGVIPGEATKIPGPGRPLLPGPGPTNDGGDVLRGPWNPPMSGGGADQPRREPMLGGKPLQRL